MQEGRGTNESIVAYDKERLCDFQRCKQMLDPHGARCGAWHVIRKEGWGMLEYDRYGVDETTDRMKLSDTKIPRLPSNSNNSTRCLDVRFLE